MPQYHNKNNPINKSQLSDPFASLINSHTSQTPINPEQSRHSNKEKSELCKQYVQTGFCMYQKRCKFAHGSHELQSNREKNMKYKTKRCEHFWQNYNCIYGNRCNYIHRNGPQNHLQSSRSTDILTKKSSRLLEILSCRHDQ